MFQGLEKEKEKEEEKPKNDKQKNIKNNKTLRKRLRNEVLNFRKAFF